MEGSHLKRACWDEQTRWYREVVTSRYNFYLWQIKINDMVLVLVLMMFRLVVMGWIRYQKTIWTSMYSIPRQENLGWSSHYLGPSSIWVLQSLERSTCLTRANLREALQSKSNLRMATLLCRSLFFFAWSLWGSNASDEAAAPAIEFTIGYNIQVSNRNPIQPVGWHEWFHGGDI